MKTSGSCHLATCYVSMLLACDVIKEMTGVAPIVRFPLGGSLLLQFHNVDFQAAFVVFPLQTGIFEVGKQQGGPKFSGKNGS